MAYILWVVELSTKNSILWMVGLKIKCLPPLPWIFSGTALSTFTCMYVIFDGHIRKKGIVLPTYLTLNLIVRQGETKLFLNVALVDSKHSSHKI